MFINKIAAQNNCCLNFILSYFIPMCCNYCGYTKDEMILVFLGCHETAYVLRPPFFFLWFYNLVVTDRHRQMLCWSDFLLIISICDKSPICLYVSNGISMKDSVILEDMMKRDSTLKELLFGDNQVCFQSNLS